MCDTNAGFPIVDSQDVKDVVPLFQIGSRPPHPIGAPAATRIYRRLDSRDTIMDWTDPHPASEVQLPSPGRSRCVHVNSVGSRGLLERHCRLLDVRGIVQLPASAICAAYIADWYGVRKRANAHHMRIYRRWLTMICREIVATLRPPSSPSSRGVRPSRSGGLSSGSPLSLCTFSAALLVYWG